MSRIALASLTAAALLFVAPASRSQTPAAQIPTDERRLFDTPCAETPGGNSLRFVCPLPILTFEEFEDTSSATPVPITLRLPQGTPLRITIDQRVRVARVGEAVRGHVVEAVFAFDQAVIPEGTLATGHITEIEPVSPWRRIECYVNGNFSPPHQYKVTFDKLQLPSGQILSIDTTVAPGTAEVIHLATKVPKNKYEQEEKDHKNSTARAANTAKQEVKGRVHEASAAVHQVTEEVRAPGRLHRLKQFLVSQSPYRRQYVGQGTRFNATLNQGLDFGSETRSPAQLSELGSAPAADTVLRARLVMEVTSETAERGDPVVAQLTEPLYSAQHRLLLPADSRLIGRVLEAKAARHLHRNGELRIIFEEIELPGGALQSVQGTLEGIEVDRGAHMKLDEEGGAHATDSKTRYLSTGVAILLAAAAANPDAEHGTVDQAGDPAVRAGAGASGFGLAGTVIGLVAKSNVLSVAFSAYGASASIYANFLSRGRNVVLPKNAPLEIGLGTTHPSGAQH